MKCINFNCNRKQEKTNKKNQPVKYRPFCSTCHGQHIEGKPLDPGIMPFNFNISNYFKTGNNSRKVNPKGKFVSGIYIIGKPKLLRTQTQPQKLLQPQDLFQKLFKLWTQ